MQLGREGEFQSTEVGSQSMLLLVSDNALSNPDFWALEVSHNFLKGFIPPAKQAHRFSS